MTASARPLAIAAVTSWVLTASIGAYMLRTWIARGGLRRQRTTGVGVPPAVVFGHASAALTGLAIWIGFVATQWDPLGWLGVGMVTVAIGLGLCTVTLWTPYPVVDPSAGGAATAMERPPGPRADPDPFEVTDDMIATLLTDPFPARRRPRLRLAPFVPVAHGFAALTTFMLAALAAISAILGLFSYL